MAMNKRLLRYLPVVAGVVMISLVAIGLIMFISGMDDNKPMKKSVQVISLISPPPPPPPKVEKLPEPEVEEVKLDEPEPQDEMPEDVPSDEPPPGDLLGLDAEGGAGGDAFGLLGKKGGRSLLGSGGNAFAWYTNKLSAYIENALYDLSEQDEFKKLRNARYSVPVKFWIDKNNNVRLILMGTTGDEARDKALKKALQRVSEFQEQPPDDMPQPIRVRIASRI